MPQPPNYPLRFTPLLKERIWGGDLLPSWLGMPRPYPAQLGETWEIADRPEESTLVANGPWAGTPLRTLVQRFPESLIGPGAAGGQLFPLLMKFIGTRDKLSLQVHPTEEYARAYHPSQPGKSELWYVVHAEPQAELWIGFRDTQTMDQVQKALLEERFAQLLHHLAAKPGDAFFLPAGRVHGLGAGLVVAEIQENSELTYRIYDYGRTDRQGQPRPLHVPQALANLRLTDVSDGRLPETAMHEAGWARRPLLADRSMQSELRIFHGVQKGPVQRGFQILVVTRGQGRLVHAQGVEGLGQGAVLLLPAGFDGYRLEPQAGPLEVLFAWK
jgi:mannose-6-phosphate isomerase